MAGGEAWRKLHLAVYADIGMIMAQTRTDQDADDPSQVAPLLDQIDGPITWVTADGAYDGSPTCLTIAAHGDGIEVVIPPRSTAESSTEPTSPTQRDWKTADDHRQRHLAWQATTGYGQHADCTIDGSLHRCGSNSVAGTRLRCSKRPAGAIGVAVLNRMLARTSEIRPSPTRNHVTGWSCGWGHLALHSASATTP